MKVEQVYTIVNNVTNEILGKNDIAQEDISKVVDLGKTAELMFGGSVTPVDNYVRKLIDHIGKTIFVNRKYEGRAPSVLMDGWEYGSVLEKIDSGIPEAEISPTWNLQDGQTYNQDVFNSPPDVVAKFFNDRVTFQIPLSIAEEQVKSAFSNVGQLNAFFSMIETKLLTSMTIKTDSLIMATINNLIANTYLSGTALTKVNLLALYNAAFSKTLKAANALSDPEFIRYASYMLKLYSRRLTNPSVGFNIGGRVRHTPVSMQKIVMLDMFADAADVYLQSDTFHDEFTKLPNADKVSFWQGSGMSYDFSDVSSVNIMANTPTGAKAAEVSGILATIFDHDALGVNTYKKRVTQHYNAVGEFINSWYKMDAQYFNDINENFVLFYVEDPAPNPGNQVASK